MFVSTSYPLQRLERSSFSLIKSQAIDGLIGYNRKQIVQLSMNKANQK